MIISTYFLQVLASLLRAWYVGREEDGEQEEGEEDREHGGGGGGGKTKSIEDESAAAAMEATVGNCTQIILLDTPGSTE